MQLIVFAVVSKHLNRGDSTVDEDQRIQFYFAAERYDDIPLVVRFKFASAKNRFSRWHVLSVSVKDAKGVAGVAHALHRMQMSFVNKGSATLAARKDIDYPYAAPLEFGHLEQFPMTQVCGLSVGEPLFNVCN